MKARLSWFVAAATLAAGCSSTRLTNLTPEQLPRNPANTYPFEVSWKSNRRSVGTGVDAFVLIGDQSYPMTPVPNTRDRWEARIPVPEEKSLIPYQYKFVFQYPGVVDVRKADSDLSPSYRLKLGSK